MTDNRTITLFAGLCLAMLAGPCMALSAVEDLVQRKAEILRIVHKKAKKALANAAQDHAFAGYFTSTDATSRGVYKERIDSIALGVQSRFDAEEMCLIDPEGNEISRIVGNNIAHDLSHDEAHANFFAPGFAHKPRSVYVSPLYLSTDANKWVVAYVTPIMVEERKLAILHYEHGLDTFQRKLNRDLAGDEVFLLTVDSNGYVITDSRRPIPSDAHQHDHGDMHDHDHGHAHKADAYFQRFAFGGANLASVRTQIDQQHSLSDAGGRRYQAAYAEVEDWTLVAFRADGHGDAP